MKVTEKQGQLKEKRRFFFGSIIFLLHDDLDYQKCEVYFTVFLVVLRLLLLLFLHFSHMSLFQMYFRNFFLKNRKYQKQFTIYSEKYV